MPKSDGWKNLKPIKPGEVRNKTGTKRKTFQMILRKIGMRRLKSDKFLPQELKEKFEDDDKATRDEALMEVVYLLALNGQSWAVQFIAERLEGKVADKVEPPSRPNRIIIEHVDRPQLTEGSNDGHPVSGSSIPASVPAIYETV